MSLLLLGVLLAATLPPGPDRIATTAARVESGEVRLDGQLDEAVWGRLAPASDFVQRSPNPGTAASERTEARVAYDDEAVYVAMRMFDSQAPTTALGRRDVRLASDYASVVFDSYNDDRTAFQFETNPSGVQRDFLFYDDVREDGSWDAVWDVATARDAEGWTAEFRIPFSQLRYTADEGPQTWGVQFFREILRTGERVSWAPILPEDDGFVSRFGELDGLRGLAAPKRLELVPYVASAVTRAPGTVADPFYAETEAEPRVGLDLKYGITSDVTLTATVNPDFGQVEADPAQVNLGGFELFFQERRPFFVEGVDVFSLEPRRYFSTNRPDLLYTRRIGRAPQRSAYVPSEAYGPDSEPWTVYTDAPQQTTILGAAKVSGRAGGITFGVLNAVTAPEYGRYQSVGPGGALLADDRALVQPASNYAVARARASLGSTRIGGLLTSVHQSTADPAIAELLPRQAYVAGLDLEQPLSREWLLSAQVAGSLVEGSAASITSLQTAFPRLFQRPDADHLRLDETRTALAGTTGELNVIKTGGEPWQGSVHAQFTTPGFDANALGFQSRADDVGLGGVLIYSQNETRGILQRWSANVFGGLGWNFAGDRRDAFVGGNANVNLTSFWGGGLNWNAYPRTATDRLTRGGPLAESPAGARLNLNVWSDDRKAVSGYAWSSLNGDELGGRGLFAGTGIEARPASNVTLRVGPELGVSTTARQYVGAFDAPQMTETFGTRYVFAEVAQRNLGLEARADWTFSPTLSLQLYARPFVASGRYARYQQLGAPGQLELPVFGQDAGSIETGRFEEDAEGNAQFVPDPSTSEAVRLTGTDGGTAELGSPDFTFRALQGNAVLRWQYRPGSTLFFVWQQQRSGGSAAGDLRLGRDLGDLFADELTNVFLVKLSYWLG